MPVARVEGPIKQAPIVSTLDSGSRSQKRDEPSFEEVAQAELEKAQPSNHKKEVEDARARADFNGDGRLDFFDVSEFLNLFHQQDKRVDLNHDGTFDRSDVKEFLHLFQVGSGH